MLDSRLISGDFGLVYKNNRLVATIAYMPDGYYRVFVEGNLDRERDQQTYGSLSDVVMSAIDSDVPLVFDLRRVEKCDASALCTVARIARKRLDRKVSLVGASDELKNLFEIHKVNLSRFYKSIFEFLEEEDINLGENREV